jgi:hypothetical protein
MISVQSRYYFCPCYPKHCENNKENFAKMILIFKATLEKIMFIDFFVKQDNFIQAKVRIHTGNAQFL